MAKYILKRLLRSIATLFVIMSVVFSLLRLMPIEGYFNNYEKMSPTQIKVGMEKLGLNQPLPRQLLGFYGQLLQGDLGKSAKIRVNYPIDKIIASKMPLSMQMGLMSVALAILVGLPLGVMMAKSSRSKSRLKLWDKFGTLFVVLIQSIPASVYYLFIQIFGTEFINKFTNLPTLFQVNNPLSWVLPVVSLSLGNMAMYAMWMRRYMMDESNKDYVQLARAKGVPTGVISTR
ncbi:MAG: ABC transporter permease, partial [Oscillospiraceae bacterium]